MWIFDIDASPRSQTLTSWCARTRLNKFNKQNIIKQNKTKNVWILAIICALSVQTTNTDFMVHKRTEETDRKRG